MAVSLSDFSFVYSGGSTNDDPNQSLGGDPSSYPIVGVLDNLFDDVDSDEATNGSTDFRCFYVFNDSDADALYTSGVCIPKQYPEGCTAYLGFYSQNDQQTITIFGSPTSGTMTLQYESFQTLIGFNPNPTTFAANVQSGINHMGYLSNVRCTGTAIDAGIAIEVYFEGNDGNRYQPLMTAVINDLEGATSITTAKVYDGSPINAVAPDVLTPLASPPGVVFGTFGANNPYPLGTLYAGDGFPVWVKRVTPAGSEGLRGDGFTMRLIGNPNSPPVPPVPPANFSYTMTGGILVEGDAVTPFQSDYVYIGGQLAQTALGTCNLPENLTTLTLTDYFGPVTLTNDGSGNFVGCVMRSVAYDDLGSSFVETPVVYTFFCAPNHYLDPSKNPFYPPPESLSYPVEWRLRISYPINLSKPPGSQQGAIAGYTCATYHTAPDTIDDHAVTDPIDAFYYPAPASLPVNLTYYNQNDGHWTAEAYYHLYDTPGGLLISPDPGILVAQPNTSVTAVTIGGSALTSYVVIEF